MGNSRAAEEIGRLAKTLEVTGSTPVTSRFLVRGQR